MPESLAYAMLKGSLAGRHCEEKPFGHVSPSREGAMQVMMLFLASSAEHQFQFLTATLQPSEVFLKPVIFSRVQSYRSHYSARNDDKPKNVSTSTSVWLKFYTKTNGQTPDFTNGFPLYLMSETKHNSIQWGDDWPRGLMGKWKAFTVCWLWVTEDRFSVLLCSV